MNTRDFLDLVAARGNVIVSVSYITRPKLKAGCPFPSVSRDSILVGTVGAHYERNVQRQRAREGHSNPEGFRACSLPWGKWVRYGVLLEHKGQQYLRVRVSPNNTRRDVWRTRGRFVGVAAIEPYLYPSRQSGRQETALAVNVRNIALDSIQWIKLDGEKFTLDNSEDQD